MKCPQVRKNHSRKKVGPVMAHRQPRRREKGIPEKALDLAAGIVRGKHHIWLKPGMLVSLCLIVASNLRPPGSAALSDTDPSPGLRPPSPIGRGAGGEGTAA